MSKWAGFAIAGMWIGIGIISFNVGPAILEIARAGAWASGVIALADIVVPRVI